MRLRAARMQTGPVFQDRTSRPVWQTRIARRVTIVRRRRDRNARKTRGRPLKSHRPSGMIEAQAAGQAGASDAGSRTGIRGGNEIRLLHAQRQQLSRQSAHAQCAGAADRRRGAACRDARHEFGVDRRTSFQHARRELGARTGARAISRRRRSTSAWRRPSTCCRCIIRSASPSNGRRSTCSATGRVDFATGRGYDRREYGPFGADFEDNADVFAEGLEIVRGCGRATAPFRIRASTISSTMSGSRRTPVQRPMPIYVAVLLAADHRTRRAAGP